METKTCFIFITDNNEIVATKNLISVRAELNRVVLRIEKESYISIEVGNFRTINEANKMIDHIADSLLFARFGIDGVRCSCCSGLLPLESLNKNPSNLDFTVIDCRLKKLKKK